MVKIHHAVVLPRVYSILTTRYQVTKIILANLVPITRYLVPGTMCRSSESISGVIQNLQAKNEDNLLIYEPVVSIRGDLRVI